MVFAHDLTKLTGGDEEVFFSFFKEASIQNGAVTPLTVLLLFRYELY